jgi:hypothetical protein
MAHKKRRKMAYEMGDVQWLGFHSSWIPSHYETGSVIFVKMP